uniref:Nicastrin n=1 Tax=Electrophorus electricus TaxID=8005 RepID=A0A4W4GC36_ELEEL
MICCVQVLLRVKPSVNSLYLDVSGSSVEQKIYIELKNTVPCVRLLNATHQIGCQSSISGDTGVLHVLETEADLDWILSTGPHPPYMVLMEATFFTRPTMMRMKNSTRVAGVAVINSNTTAVESFSPHTSCPNQNTGVYREDYGPDLANCSSTVWNPLGNSMSYEDFTFPIFSLKDDNQTQCYEDHNMRVNGSAPQYPLCAMQLFSHMHAVTDTVTCMRRAEVCDPLSDFNVWASIRPINASAKGHKNNESVVIAAARLDGRSFFWDIGTSAEGTVSGIVTLLAAAHALYPVTQEAPPVRNIFFTFFQGETFDYIGSSRMVYDMKQDKFVINLDNVHSVLEIGQVGLRNGQKLWMHTDPVSRKNSTVDEEVINLVDNIKSVASTLNVSLDEPNTTQALPPSSFQRFLRVQPIPGVVLADHKSSFINRYYESLYDTAAYLNMTYPSDLSPEEQMEYETEASKVSRSARLPDQHCQGTYTSNSSYIGTSGVSIPLCFLSQLYSYHWVSGPPSANSTEGDPYCVRTSVRLAKALSPAFELPEYGSREYSTWTESRWKTIRARIFLVASPQLEMLTLGVGVTVLLVSLVLTYFISSKAELLFSSTHETPNTTY